MRYVVTRLTAAVLFLVVCSLIAIAAAGQRPSRLLVINNTGTVAELVALTPAGKQSRGRVDPGTSLPIYNVNNGDRFQASWKGGNASHVVRLAFDRAYGGNQDSWYLK